MKISDILNDHKKDSNLDKATMIRAVLKKKAKESNPRQGDIPSGWNGNQYSGELGGRL